MKFTKIIYGSLLGLMCAPSAFLARPVVSVSAQTRPVVVVDDLPDPWNRFREFLLTGTEETVTIADVCSYTKTGSNLSIKLKRNVSATPDDRSTMLVIPAGLTVEIDLCDKNIFQYNQLSTPCDNAGIFDVYGHLTIKDSVGQGDINGGDCECGGMFKIHSDASVFVNGGYLWGNYARDKGGFAYVYPNASITIVAGNIEGNHAPYGGEIYLEGENSIAIINGGQIYNGGQSIEGGVVKVCKGARLEINGGRLIGHKAKFGGGIYNAGEVTIKGGYIAGNHALEVTDGDVTDGGLGGGIYSCGTQENPASILMTDGQIKDNIATTFGSGIANDSYSSVSFSNLAKVTGNNRQDVDGKFSKDNVTILDRNGTNLITVNDSTRKKTDNVIGINTENETQSDIFTNYYKSAEGLFVPDSEEFAVIKENDKFKYVRNEYCGIVLRFGPRKTEYKYGEDLDISGASIDYVRLGGQRTNVKITPDMVSGYDKNRPGKQTVTITYNGFTTSFEVTVGKKSNPVPGLIIAGAVIACAIFIPIIVVFSKKKHKKESK